MPRKDVCNCSYCEEVYESVHWSELMYAYTADSVPLTCGVWILLSCAVVVLHDVVTGAFLDINPLVTLINRDSDEEMSTILNIFIANYRR